MLLQEFNPPPAIADIVRLITFYSDPDPTTGPCRIFPTGEMEIVLNLADDALSCSKGDTLATNRRSGAVAAGIHRSYLVIDGRQFAHLMSLRLRPGAIWRLLGLPADELTDTHINLTDLFGATAGEMTQRLAEASDPATRMNIVATALGREHRRRLHPAIAWAADQISNYPTKTRISYLADEAGLSMRRLNELFTRQIGINPKAFARIRRFHAAVEHLPRTNRHGWGAFAHEHGYSDQAHLIREFQEFSGFSPVQLLASSTSPLPHLAPTPMPAAETTAP